MGTESGKRLSDLRVCDLKVELEKRSLETSGIKMDLVKRLQDALIEENIDPDEHIFILDSGSPKKQLPNQKTDTTNGDTDEPFILDASNEEYQDGLDADDLVVKDEAEEGDEIVDEVGEVDKESFVEELEKSSSDVQRSLNEANNGENEDSLNLTIGEDEEKIFQDEDTEEKTKDKSAEKSEKDNKSTDASKSLSAGTKLSSPDGGDEKNGSKVAEKEENKSGKKDDSDQKASSLKSSTKDDKELTSASKSSKTKTSSSSTSSGSRNLWVSGLSSFTRATDLKIIFSKYGKVVGAKVVTNTRTPGTRCYGLVTMGSSSDASKCIEHLHRTELHGKIISVERTKSDICMSKMPKTDSDKKTEALSDRKKSDKETKKDDSGKDVTKADSETSTEIKKRDSATERKRDNSNIRQRITVRNDSSSRRPMTVRSRPMGESRDILSFQKIRDERERQRLRERERKLREEERRRDETRRRQREEEDRLLRERERLKKERIRLEREKADLLRLERERQKLEREKIELERLELKRQQLKIEEAKRAIKRPAEHDRYSETDRKRSTNDRRFEPPPPPRFDTSISSRSTGYDSRGADKKRVDDYSTSKRDDYKRDDYKRDPFKRPVDYTKREIESARHTTTSSYDSRAVAVSSTKDRYGMTPPQGTFSNRVRDDRDSRSTNIPSKSRYLESSNDSRYPDERSGGSSSWAGTASSSVKPFSHMQSVAANDPWGQSKSDSSWRSMEQNQDRYDRTYNERKSQVASSQYMDAPRQNSFIGRPQDRYNNQISSRFENGRF